MTDFAAGALRSELLQPTPNMTPIHASVKVTDAELARLACKLYEMRIGIRT